jgi:hypothetical protein
VSRELLVPKGFRVFKVLPELRAQWEIPVLKVLWDQQVRKEQLE